MMGFPRDLALMLSGLFSVFRKKVICPSCAGNGGDWKRNAPAWSECPTCRGHGTVDT